MSESNGTVETLTDMPFDHPIRIATEDYSVREADPEDFAEWLAAAGLRQQRSSAPDAKVDKAAVKAVQEENVTLISISLFRKADNAKESRDKIRGWPAHTRSRLFTLAQEANGLTLGKV